MSPFIGVLLLFHESMTISNSVQFTILHHYVGDLDCLTLFAYMYIQPPSNLKRSCSVFCNQTCNPTQDWCSLALLVDNLIVSYQNGGNFFLRLVWTISNLDCTFDRIYSTIKRGENVEYFKRTVFFWRILRRDLNVSIGLNMVGKKN